MLCSVLPDIRFGSVSLTGTGFGSVATYVCDAGYILAGSLTRTCQASGEWSGEEPTCEGVCCVCVCVWRGESQAGEGQRVNEVLVLMVCSKTSAFAHMTLSTTLVCH